MESSSFSTLNSNANKVLVNHLEVEGVLHSLTIKKALFAVERENFVPPALKHLSYEDTALPLEEGQTISQPYTVVFMLEQLSAQPGQSVFEAGYGSGWQTALLAHLVGPRGMVYAFEINPALCRRGRSNLQRYPNLLSRISLFCLSAARGYPEMAPFDRIICGAEVAQAPQPWREQLKIGGRMVYPSHKSIMVETKLEDGSFKVEEHHGFVFVPFR
jgi:protein-L-isoaspartate(D-aspartate) O-methyltransferase